MEADAAFDECAIGAHVSMLHELAHGVEGELVLAVFGEDPAEVDPQTGKPGKLVHRHVERFQIGDVDGMTAAAMRFSGVPHANVYAPLSVVRRGLRDGQRGSTGDIAAVLGLVADMDADTGHAGEMPVEASLVIETSPGNFQPLILFDRPLSPAEAKLLAESLRVATRSDSGTADIAHVWRVPGTHNWPNAKKLSRGRSAAPAPVMVVKAWDGCLRSFEAVDEALRPWRLAPQAEAPRAPDGVEDGAGLPAKLFEIIHDGVEIGERSQKFMHAVGWLKDLGYQPDAIEELLAAHPTGIAEKYDSGGRLRQEIDRCYGKARSRCTDAFADVQSVDEGRSQGSLLLWYGDEPPQPPSWLVRSTLPETGVALLAGQYGTGKTFVASDLAASILTGADFMGQQVCRRGGVLWLAAEGEAEVEARLTGVIDGKLRATLDDDTDRGRFPFARQKFDVPSLTDKDAHVRLAQLAEEAQLGMRTRFDAPLALIVIDTLAAAACFDDENSASETQRVMDLLRRLSRSTGALVVAIDHFGKMTDTGVRGSSAKGGAADAILAILAKKTEEGEIKERRLAVTKLRSGATGRVVPFDLRSVPIAFGEGTTCVVDWDLDAAPKTNVREPAPLWTGKSRILKRALDAALDAYGSLLQPHGDNGPKVRAVDREKVRDEFYASYSAASEAKPDSKRRTFQRLLDSATGAGSVGAREVEGQQWLWLVEQDIEDISRTDRTAPTVLCPVRPSG